MKFSFLRQSVGAKIALATSGALLFVTLLFISILVFLDLGLLSKFSLVSLLVSFFCLVVLVASLLIMVATGFFVGRPLQKLTTVMKDAESGNFLVRAPVGSNDELAELALRFNAMLAHITDLDARKIETERELVMAQDLSLLYSISQSLGRTLELGEFFPAVKRILSEVLHIKEFSLLFYNDSREGLIVKSAGGFQDNQKIQGMKFLPGEGICGLSAEEGRTIYIEDTSREPRYLHYKGEKKEDGSFVSIPLVVSGIVVGVLNVSHEKTSAFSATDIRTLESVANQMSVAFERSRLYMKVKELSIIDELTGLYNRRHFQTALRLETRRASRFSRPLSLLMIDVDYFKNYNDTYGHLKGDIALKQLAKILSEHVREVDTVARFGGEEFVIILPDTSFMDALTVATKLKNLAADLTSRSFQAGGTQSPLTVSIGVSSFPQLTSSEEELLNTADIALYQAKSLGRNQVMGYQISPLTGQRQWASGLV